MDIDVSAKFVSKFKILNYSIPIPLIYQKQIEMQYGLSATKFYIPEKEGFIFDGWYLDQELTKKVTDGNGYYFRGNTIFYDESNTLYPKWITKLNETFKILMVFAEESHAQLPTHEQGLIEINYKMPLMDRMICDLIPKQVSYYLNEWFNDSIQFEVDPYYATESIGYDSYKAGISGDFKLDYSVSGLDIPDVFPIFMNYRSIITTINMNDYDYKLHTSSGSATQKYGCIYMESFLKLAIHGNFPLEDLFDLKNPHWNSILDIYLHEFTHTVELGLNLYSYHAVESYYSHKQIRGLQPTKDYLLNQAMIEDLKVGIPFDFWIGKSPVSLNCNPSSGYKNGKIIIVGQDIDPYFDNIVIKVPFGSEILIEAIPYKGWRFVGWSDGIKTTTRHITNIISRIDLKAIFEKIS